MPVTLPSPTIRHFANAADFCRNFIIQEQIDKYLPGGRHFIDDALIRSSLRKAADASNPNDPVRVREILAKSLAIKTLDPDEVATLIYVTDPALLAEMREAALKVKRFVYDNRIVVFAPLYISNFCVNRCAYCGFRGDNCAEKRRMLTMDELREEIDILAGKIGWKPDGMGSRTKWYFWPNALVREIIGLVVDHFLGVLCFCLAICALMFLLSAAA